MPMKYWDEAFRTTVYLINILLTPNLNESTPMKVFLMYHLYDILRFFACSCFPNLKDFSQPKLHFESTECTFIGYSLNQKGNKCLGLNRKVIISRNVIFNENSFTFVKYSINTC